MKKHFIAFALAFSCVCTSNAENNPATVSRFYSNMKSLETAKDVNAANSCQQRMANCFYAGEQGGIDLSMDGLGEMTSASYTMKLFFLLYRDKSLTVKYSIDGTEVVEQPDQTGGMEKKGAQHYITTVTKYYTQDGKTVKYNDKVATLISNGLIVDMENVELSGSVTPRPTPTEDLNVEQLRARAAYYYSKKQYETAYDYYEKLVSKAPTDGDASYRIALLTFWRKGCKYRFSKKQARSKALAYIDKAIQYGNYEISKKATNVKNNWENGNVYF